MSTQDVILETVIDMNGKVDSMQTDVSNIKESLGDMAECQDDLEERVGVLETTDIVLQERSKWEKARPFVIGGTIGGVSLSSLIGASFLLVKLIAERV